MWLNIKLYLLRFYRYTNLTVYLFVFLWPTVRLVNMYNGYVEPLYLLGFFYLLCSLVILKIGSSHIAFINYFALYLLLYTETFWYKSYFFLIVNYWFILIVNWVIILIFYFLIPSNWWFIYIFYYWLSVISNLLFFKIYFSESVIKPKDRPGYVYFDPLLFNEVYANLFNQSIRHFKLLCLHFNLDFKKFKSYFNLLRVKLKVKFSTHNEYFKHNVGKRRGVSIKYYRLLMFFSTINLISGFIFVRFFIWI